MFDRYEDPVFKLELQELPAYKFVALAGEVYQALKRMDAANETRYDKYTRLKFNKLQKIAEQIIDLIQAYEKQREPEPVTVSHDLIEDYILAKNRWQRVQNPEYFREKIKEERERLVEEQKFYEQHIKEQSEKVAAMEDEFRHELNSKRDRIVSEKAALKQDLGDYQDRLAQQDDGEEALSCCFGGFQQNYEARRKADLNGKIATIRERRAQLKEEQGNIDSDDENRKKEILDELSNLKKQELTYEQQLAAPVRRVGLFSTLFPNLAESKALRRKADLEAKLKIVMERLADLDKKEAKLNLKTNATLEWEQEVLRLADDRKTNIDMVINQSGDDNLISARMEKEKWDAARGLAQRQKDIDDTVNRYFGEYPPYYMFEMLRLYILLMDCVQALDHRPDDLRLMIIELNDVARVIQSKQLNFRSLYTLHEKADKHPEEKMQPIYQEFDDKTADGKDLTEAEKNLRARFMLRVFSVKNFNAYADAALFRRAAPPDMVVTSQGKDKEEEIDSNETTPVNSSLAM